MKLLNLLIICLLLSCNESNHGISEEKENDVSVIDSIPSLTMGQQKYKQVFHFPASGKIIVEGLQGTIIDFPSEIFEFYDASVPDDSITIELIECYSINDIIANNLSTESKLGLLETGGMINLTIISNGRPLRVKPDKNYELRFPINGKEKIGMQLFKGSVEKNNIVSWDSIVSNKPVTKKDAIIYSESGNSKLTDDTLSYYIFNCHDLEWLNCDRIINDGEAKVLAFVNEKVLTKKPVVYIVFSEISVIKMGIQEKNTFSFSGLPTDKNAVIISSYQDNGRFYFFNEDITVQDSLSIKVEFESITLEAMKSEIDKIVSLNNSFPRVKF